MSLFTPKTVAGIMGDFSKKISQLEDVKVLSNQVVTKNTQTIKDLKTTNLEAQREISLADKAITALRSFTGE